MRAKAVGKRRPVFTHRRTRSRVGASEATLVRMTATARRLLTRHTYAVLDAAYDAGVREFDAARSSVAPRSSSGDGCARADPRA